MLIYLKGLSGNTISIEVEPNDPIGAIKESIKKNQGLVQEIQLLFAGKVLEDHKTLTDYNIIKESTIQIHWEPPKKTVCVTGATGFVAGYVILQLLQAGYNVRYFLVKSEQFYSPIPEVLFVLSQIKAGSNTCMI